MGRRKQRIQETGEEKKGQKIELDSFDDASSSSPDEIHDNYKNSKSSNTNDHYTIAVLDEPIIALPTLFDSLEKQVKELRKRVFKFSKTSSTLAPLRDRKSRKAEEALTRAKEALERVEQVFYRAEPQQRIVYEVDLNRLKNRITKLEKEFSELKDLSSPNFSDRQKLLSSNAREGASPCTDGEINITEEYPQQMQQIMDLQSDNLDRLAFMVDLNEDTIQIGERAAARLKAQREKLDMFEREVNEVGTGMKRAKKEMSSLYRNLACSKVIILLVIVVSTLGIAALLTNLILQTFGIKLLGPNSVIANVIANRKKKKQQGSTPTAIIPLLLESLFNQ